ncbi:MAG: hypothetical protein JO341_10490 [Gammaproteobacteria bacterium]|nr:hypothetical protein [Gammaproteobacteria bacterium]MBV9621437.1 hypothetical protein [Gammaproteobacteria bacterium]
MDHTQLEALARAVAAQNAYQQLAYFIALLALSFIGTALGSLIGSYMAKRGEVAAQRAARQEILEGLRQSTKVSEEVKSAVSLREWSARERTALRRTKLEEMMLMACRTHDWLALELSRVGDPTIAETPSPQPMMMTLGKLYFPQLKDKLRAFEKAADAYASTLGKLRLEANAARNRNAHNAALAQAAADTAITNGSAAVLQAFKDTQLPLFQLQDAAAAAMEELNSVPAPA